MALEIEGQYRLIGKARFCRGLIGGLLTSSIAVDAQKVDRAVSEEQISRLQCLLEDFGFDYHEPLDADIEHASHSLNFAREWAYRITNASNWPVYQRPVIFQQSTKPGTITIHVPTWQKAANLPLALFRFLLNSAQASSLHEDAFKASLQQGFNKLKRFGLGGTNKKNIVYYALQHGLSVLDLPEEIYQIGLGKGRRLLNGTSTENTSHIFYTFQKSKTATASVLRTAGFPTVDHYLVESEGDAFRAAEALGYPVVLKPDVGSRGADVVPAIDGPAELAHFYRAGPYQNVKSLVEKHVPGEVHRLLWLDGCFISANIRQRPKVIGDGEKTLENLIKEYIETPPSDPKQNRQIFVVEEFYKKFDIKSLLDKSQFTMRSVLPKGVEMFIGRLGGGSSGGVSTWLSESDVHPENKRLCENVMKSLHVDCVGIDFICSDISKPWYDQNAVINEINMKPEIISREKERYDLFFKFCFNNKLQPMSILILTGGGNNESDLNKLMNHFYTERATICRLESVYKSGNLIARPKDFFHSLTAAAMHPDTDKIIATINSIDHLSSGVPFCFDYLIITEQAAAKLQEMCREFTRHIFAAIAREIFIELKEIEAFSDHWAYGVPITSLEEVLKITESS